MVGAVIVKNERIIGQGWHERYGSPHAERNALAAKAKLKQLRIRLIAEDTGLNYGRTVELHCETGDFYIKAIGKPVKKI